MEEMISRMIEEAKNFPDRNRLSDINLIVDYMNDELFFGEKKELLTSDNPKIFRLTKEQDYYNVYCSIKKHLKDESEYGYFRCKMTSSGFERFRNDYPYSGIEQFLTTPHNENEIYKYIYMYLKYPHIETMIKCPELFSITVEMIFDADCYQSKAYHECFKAGKNIDEITGLKNYQWKAISSLSEGRISIFRNLREWTIKENLSVEDFNNIADIGLKTSKINKIRKIIVKRFNKKRLFTTSSLLKYFRKIDMYQAIDSNHAADILYDYLTMCYQMRINPIIDTDSLKREHDVCARNYRIYSQKHAEEICAKNQLEFEKVSKRLQAYEWSNDGLSAITAHKIREIIDEGINNRNCVGSYTNAYIHGRVNLFFIRKTNNINQSYITIELNEDLTDVEQAYYYANREITSEKDIKFIKNWVEHIQQVKQSQR